MEKIFFKNKENHNICGIIDEPSKDKKIIIIIHGYSANKEGGAKKIAEELSKNKLNSLRIDLDDCGESEAKFEFATISKYIATVESAMEFCKKRDYNEISFVGTSTGGLIVTATALKHPEIKRIVLRAPASSNDRDVLDMEGEDGLRKWEEQGYIYHEKSNGTRKKIRYEFVEDGHQYTMFDKVKDIKIPTLILQGTEDKSVSPEDTKRLAQGFPNAKLEMIQGAGHSLGVNGDFTISLNLLVSWFK